MAFDTRSPAWRGLKTENVDNAGFIPAIDTDFGRTDNDGLLIATRFERILNNDHQMRPLLVVKGYKFTVSVTLTKALRMRLRIFRVEVPNLGTERWQSKLLSQVKWLIKQNGGVPQRTTVTSEAIELTFTHIE